MALQWALFGDAAEDVISWLILPNCGPPLEAIQDGLAGSTGREFDAAFGKLPASFMHTIKDKS